MKTAEKATFSAPMHFGAIQEFASASGRCPLAEAQLAEKLVFRQTDEE